MTELSRRQFLSLAGLVGATSVAYPILNGLGVPYGSSTAYAQAGRPVPQPLATQPKTNLSTDFLDMLNVHQGLFHEGAGALKVKGVDEKVNQSYEVYFKPNSPSIKQTVKGQDGIEREVGYGAKPLELIVTRPAYGVIKWGTVIGDNDLNGIADYIVIDGKKIEVGKLPAYQRGHIQAQFEQGLKKLMEVIECTVAEHIGVKCQAKPA